jgi:hypothetical protein
MLVLLKPALSVVRIKKHSHNIGWIKVSLLVVLYQL